MPNQAPYPVKTPRLVLRCSEPSDAHAMLEVTLRNREHLAPFLPRFFDGEQTLDEKALLVRRFRGRFDGGEDFTYAALDRKTGEYIGGTGLYPRGSRLMTEIGYWIDGGRARAGLATEMAAAMTRVAIEICEYPRVEIRCLSANVASRRVAEKLDFRHEGCLRATMPFAEGDLRDLEVYALLPEEYESSPARAIRVDAYDLLGRELRLA